MKVSIYLLQNPKLPLFFSTSSASLRLTSVHNGSFRHTHI